jgi:Sulfotransferase family
VTSEAEVRPVRVVYICSAARCGSTVTDMFLGAHSRITSLGEANFLGKAIRLGQTCTCGAPIPECRHWAAVFERIQTRTGVDLRCDPYGLPLWNARARVVVDNEHQDARFHLMFRLRKLWLLTRVRLPAPLRRRVPLPQALAKAIRNKMVLYEAIGEAWDKDVVVDSSKNPFEAIELARRWPDRVLVVLVTRDGRGVYLSRRTSGVPRHSSVTEWRRYYRRALPILRRDVPAGRLLTLRYEDLAANPETVGRRLCDQLGLPFEPGMCGLVAAGRHMIDGNDTRFAAGRGLRLDERWRRELGEEDLAYFSRVGGSLNAALGYA